MKMEIYFLMLLSFFLISVQSFQSFKIGFPRRCETKTSLADKPFKNFDEMLAVLEVPVLVDFYAEWCGPCMMMKPVLEEIAGRMEAEIKVAKVDTDKSPRLGSRYQIEALPTLILFSKGEIVERYVGYMNADQLEAAVKKTLARIK